MDLGIKRNMYFNFTLHCKTINLCSFEKDYDIADLNEVLKFIFTIAVMEGEQDPQKRSISLPPNLDMIWHELIADEPTYATLMDGLKRITGNRPIHARPDRPSHKDRIEKWDKMKFALFPSLKRKREGDVKEGVEGTVTSANKYEKHQQSEDVSTSTMDDKGNTIVVKKMDGSKFVLKYVLKGLRQDATISDLKDVIERIKPYVPKNLQNLVFQGKLMTDELHVPKEAFDKKSYIALVQK